MLFTETSANWIELHDDLHFLDKRPAFVWGSRRTGYKHLYLYDLDGKLLRPLTAGEWMVVGESESGLVGVDEKRGNVYFMANTPSTFERQLYVASLEAGEPAAPHRISREAGWHASRGFGRQPGAAHSRADARHPDPPLRRPARSDDAARDFQPDRRADHPARLVEQKMTLAKTQRRSVIIEEF